jgi:hypothetical protein
VKMRMSRAWGESVADAPMFIMLAIIIIFGLAGFQIPIQKIAAITVTALLIPTPMRRISRIFGG